MTMANTKQAVRVFVAVANSTDTGDGLDVSEAAEFLSLRPAERWIGRQADQFLGASIDVVERRIVRGRVVEREMSHRVYEKDEHGRFVLEEIVEADR